MKKIFSILFFTLSSSLFTYCSAQTYYIDYDSLSSGMTSPGSYVLSLYARDSSQSAIDTLYAGGHFTVAGRNTCYNIAEWIDTSYTEPGKWYPLGNGVNNDVCAITLWNNYLYAGGKFDTASGIATNHIAKWNIKNSTWDSLKGKLNGNVYALCVYHNALYVGGDFTMADGDTVNRIAVWEDSVWASAGVGFDTGAVYSLTVSNDTLYAGGSFIKSGSKIVNHIAKWNGTSWDSLGSGTNNTVYAMTDYGSELYVGGAFTKSGGIPTSYISMYDDYISHQWSALQGRGTNDTVRALCVAYYLPALITHASHNSFAIPYLLIGGVFDSAWGNEFHYLTWYGPMSDYPSILSGPVYAIHTVPLNFEYIGGQFASAFNVDYSKTEILNNVALLDVEQGGGIDNLSYKSDITVYPNPSGGVFNLQIRNYELGMNTNVEVYNELGQQVYSNTFLIPNSQFVINLSSQPNGIYLYRVIDDNGGLVGEGKLVINR